MTPRTTPIRAARRLFRRSSTERPHARLARAARDVRWPVLGYVPAAVLLVRRRRHLGLPRALSLAAAYGTPVATGLALPPGRGRAATIWAAHMWAYKVAFEVPFDRPETLRARLRIDEPIRADTVIGLGVAPTQRLQRTLRRPPRLHPLDYFATAVYALWEAEPHLALAWILLCHPDRFPAAALRLGATFDSTLAGYFTVPTAPPWWASEREGRMDRQVRRVVPEVFKQLRGEPRPGTDHSHGANPWASMPSDHFASSLSAALMLAEADRRAGALGGAYAALLGAALVYTGEHYVIDLVAGAALALVIDAVTERLLRQAASGGLRRVSRGAGRRLRA